MPTNPITGAPYLGANDAPDLAGISKQVADWTAAGNTLLHAVDEADRDAKFSDVPAPALCVSKESRALWAKVGDAGTSSDWLTVWEDVPDTSGFAVAAGWDLGAENWTRAGKVASCYLRLARTGAAIAANSSGDVGNASLGTAPDGFVPLVPAALSTGASGFMVAATLWSNGEASLNALPPDVTLNTGQSITVAGTFIVA